MSFYQLIFGESPISELLLKLLGTTKESIPRYRDCYTIEKNKIAILTRTGGNNRNQYENLQTCKKHFPEFFDGTNDPKGPWNCDLKDIAGYLENYDLDFDDTYAEFVYEPNSIAKEMIVTLNDTIVNDNPTERWKKLITDLKNNSTDKPEVQRALEVSQLIMSKLQKL